MPIYLLLLTFIFKIPEWDDFAIHAFIQYNHHQGGKCEIYQKYKDFTN